FRARRLRQKIASSDGCNARPSADETLHRRRAVLSARGALQAYGRPTALPCAVVARQAVGGRRSRPRADGSAWPGRHRASVGLDQTVGPPTEKAGVMTRDEAHEVAKRTGLKVDRSPIGNNVWGVRTPPQEGMS